MPSEKAKELYALKYNHRKTCIQISERQVYRVMLSIKLVIQKLNRIPVDKLYFMLSYAKSLYTLKATN